MTHEFARKVVTGSVLFGLSLAMAFGQSAISGEVRDSSGAAMVGVKVEAASPALIEGSRTVVTNGEGRYAIVDIRPGTYTVTFTMAHWCWRPPAASRLISGS